MQAFKFSVKVLTLRIHGQNQGSGDFNSYSCILFFFQKPSHFVERTWTGQGYSFLCTICGKSYTDMRNALRHVKQKHMGVLFVCPLCGARYKRSDSVGIHVRNKHGLSGEALRDVMSKVEKIFPQ